jgi:valyl-tRNA synthetase
MADEEFKKIEEKWKHFWEKEKIYSCDFKKKKIYSVDTPPPTVSGKMHIGHAFSYSQQDFIVRFRRMFEEGVFYPFGTDDNGLPTEKMVERLKGVKSKDMSRSEFIELCLKTLKEIIPGFVQDWKNLGISCDFSNIYSTIDKETQKISQLDFINLYKKGLVYKKEFPTIWCPECQTAIAQAELEDKEKETIFSTLKFSCNGKDLLIATTRPEMLAACVAVFVNPEDKRYKSLIGKKVKVPLFEQEVPILADKSAEIDKGTGVLMICSFGDKYDADAIKRHGLKAKIIINKDGTLNIPHYFGLKIEDARKKIAQDLDAKGLITEKKRISHVVNTHDKCGTAIEFLTTEQWFIKILDKKEELIKQGKKIKWYPEHMFKRYENWVNGLEWDWNISRDRHFGVSIPIWECKKCKEIILANEKELPVNPIDLKKNCPKCKKQAEGETKVLDTWATSSLTPQIASNLSKDKIKIPFSLRPQAHDIIRTWAFYTIIRGLYSEKEIPWKDIVISGNVSLNGEKMSKSRGNVIDPQTVLEKFGADSLRFWAASSKLGEDLDYQEQDLIAGKKFITKLQNSSKFVFMNLSYYDFKKPRKMEKIDEMFLFKLNNLVENCTSSFLRYEYSKVREDIEKFFWKDFCDNYLEIVKKRVYNEKGDKKKSAQYVLYSSLLKIIKILAPIMPFITEEIYQEHFKKQEKENSIHISKWPEKEKVDMNEKENKFDSFVELLGKVRQEKTLAKKAMNSEISLILEKETIRELKELLEDMKAVTNAREIKEGKFKVEFL